MESLKKEEHSKAAKRVSLMLKEGIGIVEIINSTSSSLNTLNKLNNSRSKK